MEEMTIHQVTHQPLVQVMVVQVVVEQTLNQVEVETLPQQPQHKELMEQTHYQVQQELEELYGELEELEQSIS